MVIVLETILQFALYANYVYFQLSKIPSEMVFLLALLTLFTVLSWFTLLTWFALLTWFTRLTLLTLCMLFKLLYAA